MGTNDITKFVVTKIFSDQGGAVMTLTGYKSCCLGRPQIRRETELNRKHQSGTMEDKRQKDSVAPSSGAKLQFPVSEAEHLLQERNLSKCLNSSTPVLFTDMLNYVTSSILELTVKDRDSHTSCNKLIAPEQKSKPTDNIDELCQLFKDSQYMADETPGCYKTPRSNKITGLYEAPRPGPK